MINLTDPQWIIALSGIVGGFMAFGIWCIRLEGKLKQADKDIERIETTAALLERKIDTVIEKIFDKLSTIEIALAKLDSKFNNTRTKK